MTDGTTGFPAVISSVLVGSISARSSGVDRLAGEAWEECNT